MPYYYHSANVSSKVVFFVELEELCDPPTTDIFFILPFSLLPLQLLMPLSRECSTAFGFVMLLNLKAVKQKDPVDLSDIY